MRTLRRTTVRKYVTGAYSRLGIKDWESLEKDILHKSLSQGVRDQIDTANDLFATFRPIHVKTNIIPELTVTSAIDEWYKACGRLRKIMGRKTSATKIDRGRFLKEFTNKKGVRRLKVMQPISFLNFVVAAGMGVALSIADEIARKPSSGAVLGADMWSAWVCLVAKALRDTGVKVSASSSNKGTNSPFVLAIIQLQEHLPKECRRYAGYESVAKGIQIARRTLGNSERTLLLMILAGFGSLILPGYGDSSTREMIMNARQLSESEWQRVLAAMAKKIQSKNR
jgi:hypothetical protein